MNTTPHKHAAAIKAWADGAQIQFRFNPTEQWRTWNPGHGNPTWSPDVEYRVKPEHVDRYCPIFTMPAGSVVVGHGVVSRADAAHPGHRDRHGTDKLVGVLRVTIDPGTNTLVSATMEQP